MARNLTSENLGIIEVKIWSKSVFNITSASNIALVISGGRTTRGILDLKLHGLNSQHFDFGGTPGKIWFENVSLEDEKKVNWPMVSFRSDGTSIKTFSGLTQKGENNEIQIKLSGSV